MSAEARLKEKNITLPTLGKPGGNYVHWVRAGNLVFLSGKTPVGPDGSLPRGHVGQDFTWEEAYQHARLVGTWLLAAMRDAAGGNLDNVKRVVKVLGMVNGVHGFGDQPKVMNGCSDLFVEVLGDAGRHARSAVGMGSLPGNTTVEIEAVVEIA
jgi:enamine deaminase RidA (YjgF/YER057c/UK114 family)